MKRSTSNMLVYALLTSSFLTASFAMLSDRMIDEFKELNAIDKTADLEVQELDSGGLQSSAGFISIANAQPYSVSSSERSDGRLSRGLTSEGQPFLVVRDEQFNIRRVVLRLANGSITTFRSVDNSFFAEVSDDVVRTFPIRSGGKDYKIVPGSDRRSLSNATELMATHTGHRDLSASCSVMYELEVAIAYDYTFCDDYDSKSEAEETIRNVVAEASLHFEKPGICTRLDLSKLEGECDASKDPYAALYATYPSSGCRDDGMLDAFMDYWNQHKTSTQRDAAHLFQGRDFSDKVLGCAFIRNICGWQSYGVNSVSWMWDESMMASLFSHELGHNCGALHDSSTSEAEYLMEDPLGSGQNSFSPFSTTTMNEYLRKKTCLKAIPVTPSPTHSPSESPTARPTNSPSVSPTVSPIARPTTSPTKSPSVSPTEKPSPGPQASPTATAAPVVSATPSPMESPTDAPVTPPPSPSPTDPIIPPTAPPIQQVSTPSPPSSCFSGENIVDVQGKGSILMKELVVGDRVRTKEGLFSLVYSLAHKDTESELQYLQIRTSDASVIEVSDKHFVLANGEYIKASAVQVGDMLVGHHEAKKIVSSITRITRKGLYAPFTESGELMVSGVAVSSYVSFLDMPVMDEHTLVHWFVAPVRSFCRVNMRFCRQETRTNGVSNLLLPLANVVWPVGKLHPWCHFFASSVVLPFLWMFSIFERVVFGV